MNETMQSSQVDMDVRVVERNRVRPQSRRDPWMQPDELVTDQVNMGLSLLNAINTADWPGVDRLITQLESRSTQSIVDITKDINAPDEESGNSLLMQCLHCNHATQALRLAQLGADLEITNLKGESALHFAAETCTAETVTALLHRGADPNVPDTAQHQLPLHRACSRKVGAGPIVTALLSTVTGCNGIFMADKGGYIPFWTATETRNVAAMKVLLEHVPDEQLGYQNHARFDDTILHYMARKRDTSMLKILVATGAPVYIANSKGETVLHILAATGNSLTLDFLLGQRSPSVDLTALNSNERTALQTAVEAGHTECAEILMRFPASQNRTNDGRTLAHLAATKGHVDMLQLLIKHDFFLNMTDHDGNLPMHVAAQFGHLDFISKLVERKYAVNVANRDGLTPLHVAALHNQTDVVEFLIGHGAAVNTKCLSDGYTALHMAAASAVGAKCAELIVLSGGDSDVRAFDGSTPLHNAAASGNVDTMRALLDDKVDVFLQTQTGDTALHLSVKKCHYQSTDELIDHIAKHYGRSAVTSIINSGNQAGQTVMHCLSALRGTAEHYENETAMIAKLLLHYGGDLAVYSKDDVETPLHYAARTGNYAVMEAFVTHIRERPIGNLSEIHMRSRSGFSPLLMAADKGHADIVDLLLQNGARIDVSDEDGRAALHLAAENGHLMVVEHLLRYNAFVNTKTKSGMTAVHMAAENGYDDILDLLVSGYKASPDLLSLSKRTPLHLGALSGQTNVCRCLLMMQVDPTVKDSNGQTSLHLAASKNHVDTVQLFLDLPNSRELITTPDQFGKNVAHISAENGHKEVLSALLQLQPEIVLKSKIKGSEMTTLHLAAAGGHSDTVKFLLDSFASSTDENKEGMTPLQLAARAGHVDVLEVLKDLVSLSVCSVKTGLSALHVAAFFGQVEFVHRLLSYGVSLASTTEQPTVNNSLTVDTKAEAGLTALHLACRGGHEHLVRTLLLSPDLMVDATSDGTGCTALHLAAMQGQIAVVHLLMGNADINISDRKGRSALMAASAAGHTALADLLLHQGAIITAEDNVGWSAIHYAASTGHVDTVKVLIGHGASTLVKTRNGKTPLSLAAALLQPKILKYLLTKPHDTFALLQEESFLYDLVLCSKLLRYKPLQDFVEQSPSPVEIAVKISNFCVIRAESEKEREHDLLTAAAFCDTLAFDLLSIACSMFKPAHILRGTDQYGNTMVDILLDGNHKQVMSIPAVQRYFTELWQGFRRWTTIQSYMIYCLLFFFPPAWVVLSLPCAARIGHIPLVKLACHVVSHLFFMTLLLLVFMFPVEKLHSRHTRVPDVTEFLFFVWLLGIILDEVKSSRIGGRPAAVRIVMIVLSCVGVALHVGTMAIPAVWKQDIILNILYVRNFFLSLSFFSACIQILSYLSLHHVFGPMAILIRDVLKDLVQFSVILGIFLVGFTFSSSALYLDTKKPHGPHQNGTILDMTFDPWLSFKKLYFSFFDRIKDPEFPDVEDGPKFANSLVELIHMVYLMVVVIVLLKLLVATFTDTYKRISSRSDLEWYYGRARLITNMDRSTISPSPINLVITPYYWLKHVFKQGGLRNFRVEPTDLTEAFMNNGSCRNSASASFSQPVWKISRRNTFTGTEGSSLLLRSGTATLIKDSVNWKAVVADFHDRPLMESLD